MSESATEDRRAQIMHAAMTVFSRKGFHGTRMEDVAREAGVGKGTVYASFESKEHLLESIFVDVLEGHLAMVQTIFSRAGTTAKRLTDLIAYALEAARTNSQRFRFIVEGSSGMSEGFKRWLIATQRRVLDEIASLIRQGIEDGEIREVDPLVAAHLVSGAINSLMTASLWAPSSLGSAADDNERTVAGTAMNMLLKGLEGGR